MRDELPPGQLFAPGRFVADLVSELARRGGAMYPSVAFTDSLRIAVELDTSRYMNAKARELEALELASYRHTVINGWALGGTTGTRHQVIQLDERYWDSRQASPDLHPKSIQRHRREAKRAAAAAEAAG